MVENIGHLITDDSSFLILLSFQTFHDRFEFSILQVYYEFSDFQVFLLNITEAFVRQILILASLSSLHRASGVKATQCSFLL